MATVVNEFYVPTPTASQYEDANAEAVERAGEFSKRNHRLISAIGENANITDKGGLTNFKYLEDRLFSNREVPLFKSSNIDILDDDYIKSCRNNSKCVYKVLRFNRKCNIRTFDFIVTYKQVSAFGASVYKPVVVTKQFKGSFLFTGCSIIRDTNTLEEYPLKLYGKYESIGDTANCMQDLDARTNVKGGPAFTFRYTFDKDYVYLYVVALSPFRLVPLANGDFKDISFAEDHGVLASEIKPNLEVSANPFDDSVKSKVFEGDIRVWSEINLSLCDTTLSHSVNDAEFVNYDDCEDLSQNLYKLRSQEFTMMPTNDGGQVVIGMAPASQVNLEIAPDMQCIRFGSNLLSSSLDKVNELIDTLSKRIITYANNIDRVPFTIKTSIRMRGKYNVKGDYFIDSDADKLGEVVITDVGYYDSKTDKFTVKEYIFDKNQSRTYGDMNTVGNYKSYKENASDYLSLMSKDGKPIPSKIESREILHVLKSLSFEKGIGVSVYQDIAFIRAAVPFEVISAFIEFSDNDDPSDDQVIYICKDCKIRICNFKDYNMEDLSTVDLLSNVDRFDRKTDSITQVVRIPLDDGSFVYYIGTGNGLIIKIENISNSRYRKIETFGAFDKNKVLIESVNFLIYENGMIFVGGNNGNVSIINGINGNIKYIDSHFNFGDSILGASTVDESTVVFVSKNEICSYNYLSDKWNYIGDEYHTNALFNNPLKELPNPNIDYFIDLYGWEGVPTIQKDNFLYALGLRDDHMGSYKPIYKKLNLLTGELYELPLPEEELMTYGHELCLDGDTIYCVGGTSRMHDEEAYSDETFKTWISMFDTITDSWIDRSKNYVYINDNNGIRSKFSDNNFHPIASNGSIYVFKPVMYQISKNVVSDTWELTTGVYVKGLIKISLTADDITYEFDDLSDKLDASIMNLEVSCIAIKSDDKYLYFAMAERVLTLNSDDTTYSFRGYNIHIVRISKDTYDCMCQTIADVNSTEFKDFISSDPESLAPKDLFGISSVCVEYNEIIVYCATKFVLYFRTDFPIGRLHAISHTSGENADWKPLVSSGEYKALQTYKFSPKNVKILKIKNLIVLIGGSAGRTPLYLSLDSVTLTSTPRYYERTQGIQDSAILKEDTKVFSVTPNENLMFNESSICRVGNTVYMLIVSYDSNVTSNRKNFEAILFKRNFGDTSKDFKLIGNFTEALAPSNKSHSFGKIAINALDDKTLVFIPAIEYVGDLKNTANLTITAIDIETKTSKRVIENLEEIQATNTIVYNRNGEVFVESPNGSYVIRKGSGTGISGVYATSIEGNISDFSILDCDNSSRVINSVNAGKYVAFAISNNKCISVYSLTDTNKVYNVYNVQIEHADNPQLYSCGKHIYLSVGIVSNDIDYAINPTLYRFGIEDLAVENGGINSSEKTTLSLGTSEFNSPYIVSRDGEITLIGTPTKIDRNGKLVNVMLYKDNVGKFTDDNFIKAINSIEVSKINKSKYNRFGATMLPINIDGNEYVAVLAGKESDDTKTTKTVDLYNVQTNSWVKNAVELPKTLSHLSIGDNAIIGGTYEKHDDATENTFNSALEFVCTDPSKGTFELNEIAYPPITKRPDYVYPVYGVYAKLGSNIFVIPVTKSGNLNRQDDIVNIHIVTGDIEPIMKLGIQAYNSTIKVIGAMIHNQSLILILHDIETNKLNIWSYNIKTKSWGIIYSNILTIKPKAKIDASSITVTVSDTKFININNSNKTKTRAILTYVSDDKYNKGIYNIFISESDNGSVNVSEPTRVAGFLGNVSNIITSKTGKIYIIDDVEDKFYVINTDSISYGSCTHQLNFIETDSGVLAGDYYKNTFYELKSDFTIKIIDERKTSIEEKQIQIDREYRKVGLSFLKNVVFKAIDNEHFDIIGFVNESLIFVEVYKSKEEYVSTVHILNDLFDDTVNVVYTIIEGYAFSVGNNYKLIGCTKGDLINGNKDAFKVILEDNPYFYTPISFNNYYSVNKTKIFIFESKDENEENGYYDSDGMWVKRNGDDFIVYNLQSEIIDLGMHDRTLYVMDYSHNVYALDIVHSLHDGFKIVTTIPTDDASKLIFRSTDITDFFMGIRYVIPSQSDDDAYNFSGNIYKCGNEIVSINGTTVTVRENKKLDILSSVELKSDFHTGKFFTDIINKSHHIFVLTDRFIYDTDCETGKITKIKNNSISSKSTVFEIKSVNNTFIISVENGSYLIFNTVDKSFTEKSIISDYTVESILGFDSTYENYYTLLKRNDKFFFGKFNFANNDCKFISNIDWLEGKTKINTVHFCNESIYIESKDGTVYEVAIDDINNTLNIKSLYTKPSFDFVTEKYKIRKNASIKLNGSYDNYISTNSDDSYRNGIIASDQTVYALTSDDTKDKLTVTKKKNDATNKISYIVKSKKKSTIISMGESEDPLADYIPILTMNTEIIHNQNTNETQYGHILALTYSQKDRGRLYNVLSDFYFVVPDDPNNPPFIEKGEKDYIIDCEVVETELDPEHKKYNGIFTILRTQNDTVNIITSTGSTRLRFNSNYNIPFSKDFTESEIPELNSCNCVALSVADMVYILNLDERKARVVMFGNDGIRVPVKDGKMTLPVDLGNEFYDNIKDIIANDINGLIEDYAYFTLPSKLVFGNNRKVDRNQYSIVFECLKEISEYNTPYVGTDKNGNTTSIGIPISEYKLSNIVSIPMPYDLATRAVDNIQTKLYLTYDSSIENKMIAFDAVSKINMASFELKYQNIDENHKYAGKIVAFTDAVINDSLVRNDSAFYDNTYGVAIINDGIVKIVVDGETYTYSYDDNSLPFVNKELVPFIGVYGERTNPNGEIEPRYYVFFDINGNVASYDKELKAFVDISGYVNVNIPYFSTQAHIFPSNMVVPSKVNHVKCEVWASGNETPFDNGSFYKEEE